MRLTVIFVIMLALIAAAGCSNQEPAPAEQAPTSQETPESTAEPIASEDFESGAADGTMTTPESEEDEGDSSH